jgi:hypothetical protein
MAIVPPLPCPDRDPIPRDLCVNLPGGARICVAFPGVVSSNLALVEQMMAQAGAAMAPLAPAFTTINVVLAVVEFAQKIPLLIANPPEFAEALQNLIDAAAELAGIAPPLSIPAMVASMIDVLIVFIQGAIDELATVVTQLQRIASAQAILDNLPSGNVDIELAIGCANNLVDSQLVELQERLASGGAFIEIINLFMQLIGLDPVSPIPGLDEGAEDAIETLQDVVSVLEGVRAAIPL